MRRASDETSASKRRARASRRESTDVIMRRPSTHEEIDEGK